MKKLTFYLLIASISLFSCKKEDPEISGCTIETALNYNPDATKNDGSCIIEGCTDINSLNYNENADIDDGTCEYARDRFIGTYEINEVVGGTLGSNTSFITQQKYTFTISEHSSDVSKIMIDGLHNGDFGPIEADVLLDGSGEYYFSFSGYPITTADGKFRFTMYSEQIESIDGLENSVNEYGIGLYLSYNMSNILYYSDDNAEYYSINAGGTASKQ